MLIINIKPEHKKKYKKIIKENNRLIYLFLDSEFYINTCQYNNLERICFPFFLIRNINKNKKYIFIPDTIISKKLWKYINTNSYSFIDYDNGMCILDQQDKKYIKNIKIGKYKENIFNKYSNKISNVYLYKYQYNYNYLPTLTKKTCIGNVSSHICKEECKCTKEIRNTIRYNIIKFRRNINK